MKKILLIIIAMLTFGFMSCSEEKDEPNELSLQELYGTWKSIGTYQFFNSYGDSIGNLFTFDNEKDYIIAEISPGVIYINIYSYNAKYNEYDVTKCALVNCYTFDGYIRGMYSEHNGVNWVVVNQDIDFYKIKIVSKNDIRLCVKAIDTLSDKIFYAEYGMHKI